MSDHRLDYPVAAPEGVAPVIFRAQIIQLMALRYMTRFNAGKHPDEPEMDMEFAMRSALATWETDWDCDPNGRTIEDGLTAVYDDLEYWCEG